MGHFGRSGLESGSDQGSEGRILVVHGLGGLNASVIPYPFPSPSLSLTYRGYIDIERRRGCVVSDALDSIVP